MDEQLKILAIFEFVYGGLQAVFSLLGLIYVVMGILLINDPAAWTPNNQLPPDWVAWVFVGVGVVILLIGWTFALLTILSGRFILKRKKRIFCLVVAGLNCAAFPVGTVLGVITILLLTRPDAKALFYGNKGV